MLSKIICFVLIFYTTVFSIYVHEVEVPNDRLLDVKQRLQDKFQGTTVTDKQIQDVIRTLYSEGIYRSIEYSFVSKNDVNVLRFNIVAMPVIQSIRFNQLPISKHRVLEKMKNKRGLPLNFVYLDADVKMINQLLLKEGFFLASVKSFQIVSNGTLYIDIESPRLSRIELIGIQSTKPSVLYREIVSKNGQYVDRFFVDLDYQSLMSLPYFSSVSPPSINYVSSDNVTISYQVKERKMNRFDIGIEELEKDQGVALFSKFKLSHALIYSDFLVLQAQLGYLNKLNIRTYQLHYQQPWLFNRYQFILDIKAFTMYRSELIQGDSLPKDTIRTGASTFLTKPIKRLSLLTGAGVKLERVYPQSNDAFTIA